MKRSKKEYHEMFIKLLNQMNKTNDSSEQLRLSAEIGVLCGIPKEKLLWSVEDIDKYFLGDEA